MVGTHKKGTGTHKSNGTKYVALFVHQCPAKNFTNPRSKHYEVKLVSLNLPARLFSILHRGIGFYFKVPETVNKKEGFMLNSEEHAVTRRNFVKGSFAGAVATAGTLGAASMFGCTPAEQSASSSAVEEASASSAAEPATSSAVEPAALPQDEIHWSQCNVNCGGNCISKDRKSVV